MPLVEAYHSPPLVADSTNDPELSVMVKCPTAASPCTLTYPSSVLLSVSLVGLLFHSHSVVLVCLLPLIHHPNGAPCFKVRSASLCGPCRPSLLWSLVRHTPVINIHRWLSLFCKVDVWRWMLKFPLRCFENLFGIHRVDVKTFTYAWPAVVCHQNHTPLSFFPPTTS